MTGHFPSVCMSYNKPNHQRSPTQLITEIISLWSDLQLSCGFCLWAKCSIPDINITKQIHVEKLDKTGGLKTSPRKSLAGVAQQIGFVSSAQNAKRCSISFLNHMTQTVKLVSLLDKICDEWWLSFYSFCRIIVCQVLFLMRCFSYSWRLKKFPWVCVSAYNIGFNKRIVLRWYWHILKSASFS